MKVETYQSLSEIRQKFGSQKFGTIAQKLLGVTFGSLGYAHVVEREVQGVDLDVARPGGPKYAVEVKTTAAATVVLATKDFDGLNARAADGYRGVIAVLRFHLLGGWTLADAARLGPGSHRIDLLAAYRIDDLQAEVSPAFDGVLAEHAGDLMQKGRRYLDDLVKSIMSPQNSAQDDT